MNLTDESILEKVGLSQGASEEMKSAVLTNFWNGLNSRVMLAVGDHLSDEQLDKLQKAMAADDESAVTALEQEVPELQQIIEQEAQALIKELKG